MKDLIIAIVCVGLSATFVRLGVDYPPALFTLSSYLIGFVTLMAMQPKLEKVDYRYPAVVAATNIVGFLAMLLALGSDGSVVVFPIVSLAIIVTAVLSALVLKEKFGKNRLLATACAFLSLAFLL